MLKKPGGIMDNDLFSGALPLEFYFDVVEDSVFKTLMSQEIGEGVILDFPFMSKGKLDFSIMICKESQNSFLLTDNGGFVNRVLSAGMGKEFFNSILDYFGFTLNKDAVFLRAHLDDVSNKIVDLFHAMIVIDWMQIQKKNLIKIKRVKPNK